MLDFWYVVMGGWEERNFSTVTVTPKISCFCDSAPCGLKVRPKGGNTVIYHILTKSTYDVFLRHLRRYLRLSFSDPFIYFCIITLLLVSNTRFYVTLIPVHFL